MIEYPFDTTRAAVNLLFSGALERFANIRFILSHAGGTLPFLAWRLSVAPMIDKRLKQRSREEIFAGLETFWYDNALASGAAPMGALSHIAAPERIVFGSDWPFCNDRVVTEEVADFTAPDFLPPETLAMIARENALKLFPQRAAQFTFAFRGGQQKAGPSLERGSDRLRPVSADLGSGIVRQAPAERNAQERHHGRGAERNHEIRRAEARAPRHASERLRITATTEMPKPRLNCCVMPAILVAVLNCGCSTSA